MNSFELNKIALALLLTVLIIFGISDLSRVIFKEEVLTSHAFPIEVEVADEAEAEAAQVVEGPSLAEILAVASAEKGQKVFKKCKACHTTDKGGKNLVGPNLWDIVGHAKGAREGFSFSSAMKGAGGDWTYEDLYIFLKKPSAFVPKTKMSFAGLKKSSDRANVIAYMRGLSDAPVDLPIVAAEDVIEDDVVPEAAADVPQE